MFKKINKEIHIPKLATGGIVKDIDAPKEVVDAMVGIFMTQQEMIQKINHQQKIINHLSRKIQNKNKKIKNKENKIQQVIINIKNTRFMLGRTSGKTIFTKFLQEQLEILGGDNSE